jgi:hypothetical protein
MLEVNPKTRLSAGEVWSMVDVIKEQLIKTQYMT